MVLRSNIHMLPLHTAAVARRLRVCEEICDFISSDIHRLYAVNHDLKDSPFSNESLSGIGVEDPVHRGTVQSMPVFGRFLSRVKGLSSDRLRRRRGGMWRYRIGTGSY